MIWSFETRNVFFIVAGLLLALGLSGCGRGETAQEVLGYEQTGPDEMAVIKRPPLIVPPDYNLRPPRPNDQASESAAASTAARNTLIGQRASNDNRALLTGSADGNAAPAENGAAEIADASSKGQDFLLSRSDRSDRDLDTLSGTRAENRVDSSLLRRLLAWTADDQPVVADSAVVQVISRSQTVISPETSAE